MERTVGVFHKGAIAHYNVSQEKDGTYKARLLKYHGSADNTPAFEFNLQKEGRHWSQDDNAEQELVDEIGNAIEMQKDLFEEPLYHSPDRYQDQQGGQQRP
jgi:ClpP class serine protease